MKNILKSFSDLKKLLSNISSKLLNYLNLELVSKDRLTTIEDTIKEMLHSINSLRKEYISITYEIENIKSRVHLIDTNVAVVTHHIKKFDNKETL